MRWPGPAHHLCRPAARRGWSAHRAHPAAQHAGGVPGTGAPRHTAAARRAEAGHRRRDGAVFRGAGPGRRVERLAARPVGNARWRHHHAGGRTLFRGQLPHRAPMPGALHAGRPAGGGTGRHEAARHRADGPGDDGEGLAVTGDIQRRAHPRAGHRSRRCRAGALPVRLRHRADDLAAGGLRAARHGVRRRVRAAARSLRPAYRFFPGNPAPDGRHADRGRWRGAAGA